MDLNRKEGFLRRVSRSYFSKRVHLIRCYRITHIPDFVFALPYLRTLAVGHNQLRSLPFSISGSSIQDLIADQNQIDFILPTTLTGLRTLNISHNRINIGLVSTTFPNLKEPS